MSFRTHIRDGEPEDVLELEGAALNRAVIRQLGTPDADDFSTSIAAVLSLPLPGWTDYCEDWIHTERGPHGRWIVRLLRFYRMERTRPWKSKELYVADRDEQAVPLATAYARAWLFSWTTWPPEHITENYPLAS